MPNLVLLSKVKSEVNDVIELLELPFMQQFYLIDGLSNKLDKQALENTIISYKAINLNKNIQFGYSPLVYHDMQESNLMWLAEYYGVLKHGDWVIKLDASERVSREYFTILNNSLLSLEKNNILHLYKRSKLFAWKYFEDMIFLGPQHPTLMGRRGSGVDVTQMKGWSDSFLFHVATKDHIHSWIVNGFKYFSSPRSNQIELVYSQDSGRGNAEIIKKQTENRYLFREMCRSIGVDPSFDSLTEIFKEPQKIPVALHKFIENEYIIKNYIRYLAGHNPKEIKDGEQTWSFIEWFNTLGDKHARHQLDSI